MILTLEIIACVLNAVMLSFLSLKLVHMLQLGGYKNRAFLLWMVDKRTRYCVSLFVVSLLGFGAVFGLRMFLSGLWAFLPLLLYFAIGILTVMLAWRAPKKVPLKYTARVWRLMIINFILCGGLSYLLVWVGVQYMPLTAVLLPGVVLIANLFAFPIEWCVRQGYLRRAKRKLFSPQYKDLIRIGITGSYGKTTCKNILTAMLEKKYKVATSPASFNTPMGFCKTINEVLQPEHEVLIMEMGARYKGDIKTMAKLVKPNHGILTSVGPQHLETFKTLENVYIEKYQLINALPEEGIRVIGDQVEVDESIRKLKTQLLGEHNLKNIAICAEMAKKLGVTDDQITEAIAELKPVPHRLELIVTENGVNVIDDSYNASPDGTIAALEVLKTFSGQKIVLTPGLVELGKFCDKENFKFGVRMAAVADKVIIVNAVNKQMISDGLIAGGFAEENILFAPNLEAAKPIYAPLLQKGDTLLIENDLPDNFA